MLKLKVLVDNNTYIDEYYLGEPGLSYYIECDDKKILFDTGYSDAFIKNAKLMNIDLNNLDYVILSHSHNDHTGGLVYLIKEYDLSNTILLTHPDLFIPRYKEGLYIGSPINVDELRKYFKDVILTNKPYKVNDNLIYEGQVERSNDFENKRPVGLCKINDKEVDDYNLDDSCLVYKNEKGIYVISACSHSGICNMIEYGKNITDDSRVKLVIGGFHLFENDEVLDKTIKYLSDCHIDDLYPCHCVSLVCKHMMMNKLNVHEVGVGLELSLD